MSERQGDWMQTFTGRKFWPLDPRPEDVCIEDIAHALAYQCRFGGHCREFYSVAEHSIRVALIVANNGFPGNVILGALLHDAAEAYVVDVPRPLKRFLPGYKEVEMGVLRVIAEATGVSASIWNKVIKDSDEILLATEARDLMGGECAGKWNLTAFPLTARIRPRSSADAEREFLDMFHDPTGNR